MAYTPKNDFEAGTMSALNRIRNSGISDDEWQAVQRAMGTGLDANAIHDIETRNYHDEFGRCPDGSWPGPNGCPA